MGSTITHIHTHKYIHVNEVVRSQCAHQSTKKLITECMEITHGLKEKSHNTRRAYLDLCNMIWMIKVSTVFLSTHTLGRDYLSSTMHEKLNL